MSTKMPLHTASPSLLTNQQQFFVYSLVILFILGDSMAFYPSPSPTTRRRCLSSTNIVILPTSTRATRMPPHMIAKSGGRVIISNEQFEQEVLLVGVSTMANANSETYSSLLPVLVLFTAPWCGPCRLTNPVVKEVMKQYRSRLHVVEISTDDLPEVASNAGVLSIPTIQLYHGGKLKDTIVGCVAKNVLAKAIDKILEDLGMLDQKEDNES